jgi:PKD repeat protein
VANAGQSRTVNVGTLVRLDGSASGADDLLALTYSWFRSSGASPEISLSATNATSPTFTPVHAGIYAFSLTVTDSQGVTATAAPVVITANGVPTVSAGADRTVNALSAIALTASASDLDGDSLTYSWQQTRGTDVTLFLSNTASPNFTPIVPGTYSFSVTVSDERGGSASSSVTINVVPAPQLMDDHSNDFDDVTENDLLVTDGTTLAARIDYARDVDFYRFSAVAGQAYEIGVVSGSGLFATTTSIAVFDPLRRLVASASSASGTVAIPQFRPQSTSAYFVQVATVGSPAAGDYQVSIRGSGSVTVPLPPRLLVSFARTGNSLDATIATSGTTVPLSALSVLLEYDSRHLALLNAVPGPAASAFNLAPQQFTLPFLGLGFQSKESGFVVVPAGILAQVSFGINEDSDRLDEDLAIGRAVATFPAGFGDAMRPTGDPGLAPFFSAARTVTKNKAGLYPDPTAPPDDNLRPYLRLDARASIDSNANTQNLHYRWTQVSGPQIQLSDPSSAVATFVPATVATGGRYVFSLVVDNGVLESPPREVVLSVDEAGTIPVAAGRVRVPGTGRSAGALEAPLVVTRGTAIALDASQSTHPTPALRQALRYTWTQLAGLSSLPLTAATTVPIATDSLLGTYKVQLSVADTLGRTSTPETLSFVVAPPAQAPLSLRVVSAASGASATGADSLEEAPTPPAPLRVPVNGNVTLTARATAPSVIAGQTQLVFRWKQLSGPVDNARQTDGQTATNTQSSLGFTAKVPGLRRYRCEVAEQDLGGNPTGQSASRVIAVAVDSVAFVVPSAKAAIGAVSAGLAQPSVSGSAATTLPTGTTVALDARASVAPAGQTLAYRWVQLDGPPVTLSNPFASVTTFVVPELADSGPRSYAFQLVVQSGTLPSENVAALLNVVPLTRGTLVLERGLNLVGVLVDPSTPGHTYTVGDLLRDSGATWIAAPDTTGGTTRFRVYTSAADAIIPLVKTGVAYLVLSPVKRAVALGGTAWLGAHTSVDLVAGLNAVTYPLGVPLGEMASHLRSRTNCSFAVRIAPPDAPGLRRFRSFIPDIGADFPLQSGEGYLISVPSAGPVVLPATR